MHDQRLVTRLQNYWELIRRGKPMPDIGQLNLATIDDLWQQCMKIEATITQGGTHYHYRHVGQKLMVLFGRDLTGSAVDSFAVHYPYSIIVTKLEDVMKTRQFLLDENQFVNDRGRVVKYRACFMPFGSEARGITHIVVGFSNKEY